jgi:hypothetical protein
VLVVDGDGTGFVVWRPDGKPCTSRFKGVFWESWTKKWRAVIKADGKNRWLGRFRDETAAAQAYDEAARAFFGEHARLNFPDGVDAALARMAAEDASAAPPRDDAVEDDAAPRAAAAA